MAKQDTWRPPADEGSTNKAAIKAFFMSAFEEDTKPPPVKKTTIVSTEVPKEVSIPPRMNCTLFSILKHAKNDAKK